MRLMNKNEFEFAKDQLLPKKGFARYCRDAYTSPGEKIENATIQFIDGILETDLFLWPLYKIEHAEDNVECYFSPFQMFIVAMLRDNVVTEDSTFGDPENVIYNLAPNTQFIRWGSRTSYNLEAQKRTRQREGSKPNILNVAETFHKFILLLHNLGLNTDYGTYTEQTERHFTQAPNINYNFKKLSEEPSLLDQYSLAERDLLLLRYVVGDFALATDPMFAWFRYIEKHTREKKDLLTGDALLAQELYIIAEFLGKAQMAITGKQPDELLKSVYGSGIFVPYMAPVTTRYLHGNDTANLQRVMNDFEVWRKTGENARFVPESFDSKLSVLSEDLAKYVERYGYRSYKSNRMILGPIKEDTTQDQLCGKAKYYVDNFKRYKNRNNKTISEDELTGEIYFAIERVLGDLSRRFWDVFNEVKIEIDKEVNNIEREDELAKIHNRESLLKKGEIQTKLQEVRDLRDGFNSEILYASGFLMCNRCKKNRVPDNNENSNMYNTETPMCPACLSSVREGVLDASGEILKHLPKDELRCTCGKLLYKFVHSNMAFSKIENKTPVKFEIPYGRVVITAKCQDCGREEVKVIDSGWS